MSKIDVVRAAMVQAMKAKDKARKDSLSMLLSALKNAEIDKREPLTEAEEDAIVKKEIQLTEMISVKRQGHVWLFTRNLLRKTCL